MQYLERLRTGVFGIDGVNCTIVLNRLSTQKYHIDRNLKNADGSVYGNVKNHGESIKLRFNIPLMLREDNVIPYTMSDIKYSDYICNKLKSDIAAIFGDNVKRIVPNAIEVSITKQLQTCQPSDVIKLIRLMYLEEGKQTCCWNQRGTDKFEITTGVLTPPKVNEYRIKCYDKTRQIQLQKGGEAIPRLIRLEYIVQGRRIRLEYGQGCSIYNIIRDEKRLLAFCNETGQRQMLGRLDDFMRKSSNIIFEELTQGKSANIAIGRHVDILVDTEQIRRVLHRYNMFCDKVDQSAQQAGRYGKVYGIGKDVIDALTNLIELH